MGRRARTITAIVLAVSFSLDPMGATSVLANTASARELLATQKLPAAAEIAAAKADALSLTLAGGKPVRPGSDSGEKPPPADIALDKPVPRKGTDPSLPAPLEPKPAAAPAVNRRISETTTPAPRIEGEVEGFVEGESDVVAGSPTSLTYENPDGSETKKIFSAPAAFQDPETDKWTEFDATPVKEADNRFHAAASGNPTSFGNTAADSALIKLESPTAESVTFKMVGVAAAVGEVDGTSVIYREILPGVDLHENAFAGGVKEEIKVYKLPASAPAYRFEMTLSSGLSPAKTAEGDIEVRNKKGNLIFALPQGVAWEANPADPPTPVQMRLLSEGGKHIVELVPDWAWMSAPERTLPITIDPQVFMGSVGSFPNVYDLYIVDSVPNGWYDTGTNRFGWSHPTSTTQNYYQTNIKFGDLYLAPGSIVTQATFQAAISQTTFYYPNASIYQGGATLASMYRNTVFWESNAPAGPTWANRPKTIDTATKKTVSVTPGALTVDVSDWVHLWRSQPNYGMTLVANGGPVWLGQGASPTGLVEMASFESGLPPYLSVTYVAPPAGPVAVNPVVSVRALQQAQLQWFDPDGATSSYDVCTDAPTGRVCVAPTSQSAAAGKVTATVNLTSLVNAAGTGNLQWFVRKAFGASYLYSEVGYQLLNMESAPVITGPATAHRAPNSTIPVSWSDGDRGYGVTFAYSVDICADVAMTSCWSSTSTTTATSINTTQLASDLPTNTPIYLRVRKRLGNAGSNVTMTSSVHNFQTTNSQPNAPELIGLGTDGYVTTNNPEMTSKLVTDPDGDPFTYKFRLCDQPGGKGLCFTSSAGSAAAPNGLTFTATTVSWKSPHNWATTYYWSVEASDGFAKSTTPLNNSGDSAYTAPTNVPPTDGSLGGLWAAGKYPNGAPSGSVEASNGNAFFSETDVDPATVGIDIGIVRSYNSLDFRSNGGFGKGWTYPLDMTVQFDSTADLNATILMADGRREFHGRNPDGTYAKAFGYGNVFAYDTATDEYWLTDAAKTKFRFKRANSSALTATLLGVTDADGNSITVSRTGNTQVVTDQASQRSLTIVWASAASLGAAYEHITSITTSGAASATWTYTYDGDKLRTACSPDVDPGSTVKTLCSTYNYDAGNRIDTVWSPQTRTGSAWSPNPLSIPKIRLSFSYDANGRVATQANGKGQTWTYTYSTSTSIPKTTEAGTATARFTTVVTDPLGNPRSLSFDAHRRLQYSKSETDVEDWFAYNDDGYLLTESTRIAAGTANTSFATTEYSVDERGLNTRRIDPNGATWQWTYNNSGQVLSSLNPLGLFTTYTYDADANGKANQGRHNLTKALPPVSFPTPSRQWAVNETSGTVATDSFGGPSGTYTATGLTMNQPGAPNVSANQSVNFNGGALQLPTDALRGADKTFSLWFKTKEDGVLLSKNSADVTVATSTGHNPVLYVGGDGLLYANVWSPTNALPQLITPQPVNDDAWHHVMLSVSATTQTLYVDSVKIGSVAAAVNDTSWPYSHAYVGNGYTAGWPAGDPGSMPFIGRIDEISVYNRALTDADLYSMVQFEYTTASTPAFGNPAARPPLWLINKTTDQAGRVTTFEYDQGGDLRRNVDGAGLITEYTYDSVGRKLTERTSDDGTNWTPTVTNTYDAAGRLLTSDGPPTINAVTNDVHRLRTTNTYDDAGLLASVTQSDIGGAPNPDTSRTTTYHYDDASRRDRVTDALGFNTDTEYDTAGRAMKVTDARGTVVETTYDASGRETSVKVSNFVDDPIDAPTVTRAVTVSTTKYDVAGRVSEWTDALGRVRVNTYDVMGWPIRVDLYKNAADRSAGTVWKVLSTTNYNLLGHPTQVATSGRVVNGAPVMTEIINNKYDREGRLFEKVSINAAQNGGAGLSAGATYDVTTTYTFDNIGNPVAAVSAGGPARIETRTVYDIHNQPLTVTIENGTTDVVTGTVRDKRGRIITETDARNQATTFAYDSMNRATRMTMPTVNRSLVDRTTGTVTTTAVAPFLLTGYNTFGEVTERQDRNGNVTRTSRDKLGRPAVITHPSYTNPDAPSTTVSPTETFTYDSVGNLIARKDRRGYTTTFDFDRRNRVVRRTDPLATGATSAGVWRTYYDDMGNRVKEINAEGVRVDAGYDQLDRLTSQTEYVNGVFGATGVQTLTTTYTLDDAGRAVTVCSPAPSGQQRCTNTVFAPMGQVLSWQDANLNVTRYGYDGLGRQTMVIDAMNRKTVTRYDQAGRVDQTSYYGDDGTQLSTESYLLDPLGLITQVDEADGGRLTYAYDGGGQLTSATELVSASPAKSITTTFGYDLNGNQTTVTDGQGQQWGYTYNAWDLLQDQIEPSVTGQTTIATRRWTSNYDAGGLTVKETKPGPVTVNRTYDELGRLKTTASVAATNAPAASTSFAYDRLGRVVSGSHPSGTIALAYNERNQLTAVTSPNSGNSSFSYDQAGRMVRRVDGSGTASYEWDQGDRLFRETDPLTAQRRTYTWNGANQVAMVAYADTGGASRTYTYDKFGRVQQDTLKGSNNTALRTVTYGYDAVTTRLTTETVAGSGVAGAGTNTYGYDLAGRLTSWTSPANVTTAYQWDDNGNRVAVGSVTATYDQRNRLTSTSAGETTTWTPRGTMRTRVVGATTTNYTFDGLDRMTVAGTVTYTYDAFNRPTSRKVGTTTTQMTYSGLGDQPTKDGSNTISRSPAGDPISVKVGTGTAQIVNQDRHGDVVSLLTPTATALSNSVDYTPFGEIAGGANPTAVGFQGDWTDLTTKFVNMGARWYSPNVGRFISRDTYRGELTTPVSLNRYTYANDDPVNAYDPDGHRSYAVADGGGYTRPSADSARRLVNKKAEKRINKERHDRASGNYGSPDAMERRNQLRRNREVEKYINSVIAANKGKDGWTASQDPQLARTAHGLVLSNINLFDTAGKGNAPDGNISKTDFEAIRDGSSYDPVLRWAAETLLANDKDVDHKKAAESFKEDPANIANYGWKLYQTKKKKSFFEKYGGPILAVLSFVPIVGDVIDAFSCITGDLLSCVAMIPLAGSAANVVKAANTIDNVKDASHALEATTDIIKLADNATDTTRAADNAADLRKGLDEAAPNCVANSFTPDTDVLMADGTTKDIKDIHIGDKVYAADPETGQAGPRTVTRLITGEGDKDLVDITVHTDHGDHTITATAGHPFWVANTTTWTPAEHLNNGDQLTSPDGHHHQITNTRHYRRHQQVHNLTVDDIHTYYVTAGTQPLLVHNCATEAAGNSGGGFGRGGQKLNPDPLADGAPHTTFRTDPATGEVTHYTTWEPNPQNPIGYDPVKRFDGVGGSHYNKVLDTRVSTPHVQGPGIPGGVRPAEPWEIPGG
jgi:RHS repeat-associated protein